MVPEPALYEQHDAFRRAAAAVIAEEVVALREDADARRERLATLVHTLVRLHRSEAALVRQVLLSDDEHLRERGAELMRSLSSQIAASLLRESLGAGRDAAEREIDFAVRTALALLQQEVLQGGLAPTRFALDEEELERRVVDGVLAACEPWL